ncbi:NAD-dependent epimerase/dehydratase family protein [Streptomyces sp. NPDC051173]|uniref:NAD-dependent epimerase/dehydratase family protein n=1 Tax=Streptomyces sp. NPDC051173 TaxID=3155164 RepID=UPI00344DAB45
MEYDLFEELQGKNVLVTGGGGLIGSRVVAQLRGLGARPVVLCTMDSYPERVYRDLFGMGAGGEDVVVGDVADEVLVRELVRGCDFVVHAAAVADVAACTRDARSAIRTNVTGTQVVLDAVAGADRVRRLCFVSSASVYGNGNPEDWASPDPGKRALRGALEFVYGRTPPRFVEDAPLRPLSVYANTKVFGETQTALVLRAVGTSYSVVRYFSVYGDPQIIKEGSHSWVVAWFTARAALGLPLQLNGGGEQVRDFVHVDDVAAATVRALVAPAAHNEIVNVGTGVPTRIREVADLVRGHFPGVAVTETPMPPGDPLGGYASVRRMEQLLGWTPEITMPEGVARYVDWLKRMPQAVPGWLQAESVARP